VSSADCLNTCIFGAERRGDRVISPYDYIRCGETSKKVGCSIGSSWVGTGVAFDESGHSEIWGFQGGRMGIRSGFLWRFGFPVMCRRIARRRVSLIWVVLDERLAVVGGNCL